MRVKYFADGGKTYEIEAPEGTAVRYRGHKQGKSGRFLDDVLIVPWQGKRLALEGMVVVQAATEGVLGLRLVRLITAGGTQNQVPTR